MGEQQSLLASLRDTVKFFKERKTVGKMKTEHSIFIPSALMVEKSEDTEKFIKAARHINKKNEWKCPVTATELNIRKIGGIEFVFSFDTNTDFDAIMTELETRLHS